ncbi:hypothetical protein [Bacillus suaedaesalsae]|uniref:Uncharacterized protein n=1 Tax=Bacillus suaedaesalsae TaxID=2810349 RepID=A0ABS2DL34_9BACI|nr:hypothetical protein [Bacillus suaedaesalsae]MBM6619158.1 hypothetical protein [Bacillus suaedaesalsae]
MQFVGKYKQLPQIFKRLLRLEKALLKEGYSLDQELSLVLQTDYFYYDITPYDVITFASTGCDGIHFGLLTDFGSVSNLEEAFVVSICPMDFDNPIKIVARNLKEFISLVCTLRGAVTISNLHFLENREQYLNLIEEIKIEQLEEPEYAQRANYVIEKLLATISLDIIEDVYEYVEKRVPHVREKQTVLPTLDGIGIPLLKTVSNKVTNRFEVYTDTEIELDDIRTFLETASYESKLAFIRDAQFTYQITNNLEIRQLVIKEMMSMELYDEVDRLKYIYD